MRIRPHPTQRGLHAMHAGTIRGVLQWTFLRGTVGRGRGGCDASPLLTGRRAARMVTQGASDWCCCLQPLQPSVATEGAATSERSPRGPAAQSDWEAPACDFPTVRTLPRGPSSDEPLPASPHPMTAPQSVPNPDWGPSFHLQPVRAW